MERRWYPVPPRGNRQERRAADALARRMSESSKQYRHSHSQHLTDEDHLRIVRHVAKAVTDAELDRLADNQQSVDTSPPTR